jgi:predicted DNA-binding transcriptional regulator AlpA
MSRKPLANSRFLDTRQAADFLGVSVSTLGLWRWNGAQLIPYLRLGHKIAYRREDLEKWLETRLVRPEAKKKAK